MRKAIDIVSNRELPEVISKCDGNHRHIHLEGRNQNASRTARAAVFLDMFCKRLLNAAERIATIPSGGGPAFSWFILNRCSVLERTLQKKWLQH